MYAWLRLTAINKEIW